MILVQNAEIKKYLSTSKRLILRKCGYPSDYSGQPLFSLPNPAEITWHLLLPFHLDGSLSKILPGNIYQNTKLSTFAFSSIFCYSRPMEGYGMKHENPETKLIREQNQYIRILEEQLDVCKEQLKAQELLIEEQDKALALFAEAFREEGE